MNKKIFSFLFSLSAVVCNIHAVPAKYGALKFTQPDGRVISICKTGDERGHIVTTPEGYLLTMDADGYYCFAIPDGEGRLTPTAVRAADLAALTSDERNVVSSIDRSKTAITLQRRQEASKMATPVSLISRSGGGIGLMDDALLGRKKLKGLVILAEYQDVKFSDITDKAFFETMLNSEGYDLYGATGSARDYFIDSSLGQFIPEFDVYGPVALPKKMSYYGSNNPNGDEPNAAQMIYDACLGLDSEINFADYDLDGDGTVDNVFVFYAGYGEASYGSKESVWPHQWALSSGGLSLKLDGVSINKYACSNELELDAYDKPVPCGIGTFVHEFSHVLGLPDLYATSGSGGWTPSSWSVLDQGPYNNNGRTPPAYSAFERYALGWLDPIVISGPANISLEAIDETNSACIIPTGDENEFFLVENRQQQGWDEYLPGHGMLVWHIDYNKTVWMSNRVNNRSTHNYVDLEEACGKWYDYSDFYSMPAYYEALAAYAFPGPDRVTSFTDDTTPSMKTWDGKGLSLPITEITETDGVISFIVAGGYCNASVPVVTAPRSVGSDWFEAAWHASDGAVDYQLSVRTIPDATQSEEDVVDFGSATDTYAVLPEGWTFISTLGSVYTTEGYYGKSSPALSLSKTGTGVSSPLYDSDVLSVEMWLRGQLVNSSSTLFVEGLVGDSWVKLGDFQPQRNEGVTHTISELPAGVRQVRFIYNKSAGNVALDDIVIKLGKAGDTLEGYEALEVGNVTSFKVADLPSDFTVFAYKVRAVDDEGNRSAWSEEQVVDLKSISGLSDVSDDANASLKVDGRNIIWHSSRPGCVSLADLCGRIVAEMHTDGNGDAVLTAPAAGLYLLSSPSGTVKVCVR